MFQQLRDELLARLAFDALTDLVQADAAARVDALAARWTAMMRNPAGPARHTAATALERILWPAFASPTAEWWTSLGDALATIRAARPTTSASDVTARRHCRTRQPGGSRTVPSTLPKEPGPNHAPNWSAKEPALSDVVALLRVA